MEKMNLRSHLWGLRQTFRYQGFRALLWETLATCVSPFGQLGLESLCQKDLRRPLEEVRARAGILICQAAEADMEQLVALVTGHWGHTVERGPYSKLGIRNTLLHRFHRGQKCFVGKIGEKIVHYNWIAFQWEETIAGTGRFIRLEQNEALCHDALTIEAWRGKSIHTAVHNQMLLFLKKAGYRRAYTVVGALDRASRKTHHRLHWEFSGTMVYFIPRGAGKARVWRARGTLNPFVETKEIPYKPSKLL